MGEWLVYLGSLLVNTKTEGWLNEISETYTTKTQNSTLQALEDNVRTLKKSIYVCVHHVYIYVYIYASSMI